MNKKYLFDVKYPSGYNTYNTFGLNLITNVDNNTEICIFYYDKLNDTFHYKFGYNVGQKDQNPQIHPLHKDDISICEVKALERDLNLNFGHIKYIYKNAILDTTFVKTDPFNIFIKLDPINVNVKEGYFLLVFKGNTKNPIKISRTLSRSLFSFEAYDNLGGVIHAHKSDGTLDNYAVLASKTLKIEEIFKEGKLYLYEDILEGDMFCVLPNVLTYFGVSSELEMNQISKFEDFEKIFQKAKKKFYVENPNFTTSYFNDIGFAICAPIYWNLSYNVENKTAYLPVTKSWVEMLENVFNILKNQRGGPLIFNWDTAFAAIIITPFNPELACDLILQLLSYIDDDGRIPQFILDNYISDRTNPPIIFLATWIIYLYTKDKEFLSICYHKLKKYYNFLKEKRTSIKPYVMAWGSDFKDEEMFLKEKNINSNIKRLKPMYGKVGAMYESGLDDSPMWDEFEFDNEKLTLNGGCIDLTALTGYSAAIMTLIANELRFTEDYAYFSTEALNFRDVILDSFYDNENKIFANILGNDKFSNVITPTSFYPMLFIKLPKQLKEAVYQKLKDPNYFGTLFQIVSLMASDKRILLDGDYWRGRIWPPLNYLVYQGLRMQCMFKKSYEFALSSLRQFQFEWQKSAHVHENYSAYTGFGEAQSETYSRSAPFYTWGSLMGIMFLNEFFEVQMDGKLRFGNLYSVDEVKISNLRVGKNKIDLIYNPQLVELFIDREKKLSISPRALVFDYFENESLLSFKILGLGKTKISISKIGDTLSAYVRVNREIKCYANVVRSSPIVFEIDTKELIEDESTGEIVQQPILIEVEKYYSK